MPGRSFPVVQQDTSMKAKHNLPPKLGAQQMVHWFVASSYASGSFSEERVKNSVALLHKVPAARNAVLHRFTLLFEEAIRAHLDHIEFQASAPGISSEIASSLELVVTTLLELLESNGGAWAPIICTWSVEALGQISSCYKQRQVIPPPNNLVRLLNFWLNMVPMRMLLDVYRTCLKILIKSSPGPCMDSLLLASSNHSPYFDWVVADVGSTFPDAIIERVLYTGYSKFCKLRWTSIAVQPSASITMNENEQSILTSVTRILEHLATLHQTLICTKLLEMFKSPPSGKSNGHIKVALYLMNLFSVSNALLRATTPVFVPEIESSLLNTLYKQFQKVSRIHGEIEIVSSLISHLVCQSSTGSYQLVMLLLNAASLNCSGSMQGMEKPVQRILCNLLPLVLKDLKHMALKGGVEPENVFVELQDRYTELCDDLLKTTSSTRKSWLYELLLAVSLRGGYATSILSYILIEATKAPHLEIYMQLHKDVAPIVPHLLQLTLQKAFLSARALPLEKSVSLSTNIYHLATSEMSRGGQFRLRLLKNLFVVIDHLVSGIDRLPISIPLASASVNLLCQLMPTISTSELGLGCRLLPLTQALVFYFYQLLRADHVNNDTHMQKCQEILVQLAQTSNVFAVVCRYLLEGAICQERNSILFGRRVEPELYDETDTMDLAEKTDNSTSLLSIHRKLCSRSIFRRYQAHGFVPVSVEAGLIGNGPKRKKKCPKSKAAQASNNDCLSLLVYRCCCKTSGGVNITNLPIPDASHTFDTDKLVHLADRIMAAISAASPSLATAITLEGNVEWPLSTLRKLTIERDLKIFHFMDEHPFMWQLLFLVAHNHRAFTTVSPLIRSCMSVLMSHCESSRYNTPLAESSLHYQVAIKVMQLIAKGQLVPEPLCRVGQLIHQISPYETYTLLLTVWNFIKDHPSPATLEHSTNDKRDFSAESINQQPYIAVVQQVLHANISNLGHMFSTFTLPK